VLGIRTAAIEASAIVAHPARDILYAVVPGGAESYANQLVTIDVGGNILSGVAIGSDPTTLAISDDGTTLWVGLHGARSVRKVDLSTPEPSPGEEFDLPPGDFGDLASAGPVVLLPGSVTTLAVSLHRDDVSPSFAGAVLIDEGVARPEKTPGHSGASRLTGGPPGYVYGFNDLSTGFGFYALKIELNGFTQTEHRDLIDGFDTDIFYANGMVFATSGEVVDVSNPAAPARGGVFAYQGLVAYDDVRQDIVMLSHESTTSSVCSIEECDGIVRLLDVETFTQIDQQVVDVGLTRTRNLVRLDSGVLAAINDNSRALSDEPSNVVIIELAPWQVE
jgi:hypothetical protein